MVLEARGLCGQPWAVLARGRAAPCAHPGRGPRGRARGWRERPGLGCPHCVFSTECVTCHSFNAVFPDLLPRPRALLGGRDSWSVVLAARSSSPCVASTQTCVRGTPVKGIWLCRADTAVRERAHSSGGRDRPPLGQGAVGPSLLIVCVPLRGRGHRCSCHVLFSVLLLFFNPAITSKTT